MTPEALGFALVFGIFAGGLTACAYVMVTILADFLALLSRP